MKRRTLPLLVAKFYVGLLAISLMYAAVSISVGLLPR